MSVKLTNGSWSIRLLLLLIAMSTVLVYPVNMVFLLIPV